MIVLAKIEVCLCVCVCVGVRPVLLANAFFVSVSCFRQSSCMTAQPDNQIARSAGRYLRSMAVFGVQEAPPPDAFITNHVLVYL